jgi:ArpU family phage transcriptional regulator
MEQISFIDEMPKSKYVRQTERALYEYAVLKVALENEEELEKKGLGNLFPSMVPAYEEATRGSIISNPTETWGMRRAEKQIKIKQIDRAFSILSPDELELINVKYLSSYQPSDVRTMDELSMSQANYYRIKDRALRKVATALNII